MPAAAGALARALDEAESRREGLTVSVEHGHSGSQRRWWPKWGDRGHYGWPAAHWAQLELSMVPECHPLVASCGIAEVRYGLRCVGVVCRSTA